MSITLYSGPNYTGESCEFPTDGKTYTLAATGLPKVASVKFPTGGPAIARPTLRLYATRPTSQLDLGPDGSDFHTFDADTVDTGTWASAGYLSAKISTRIATAPGRAATTGRVSFDEPTERVIHDKLPS